MVSEANGKLQDGRVYEVESLIKAGNGPSEVSDSQLQKVRDEVARRRMVSGEGFRAVKNIKETFMKGDDPEKLWDKGGAFHAFREALTLVRDEAGFVT